MTDQPQPGGIGALGTQSVARMGYGAMQLFEAPTVDDAAAVLRRAIELGVNHIDTASFYGPGEVDRRIRAALAPYPDDLVIVSKVGARYTGAQPIPLAAAQKPAELRAAVEDDLRQLGLDQIPVVNLRRLDLGPGLAAEGDQIVDLDDQLAEMIALRDEGKIGGIGISAVPLEVLRRALPAGIVCVQNAYSLLDRSQEATLQLCQAEGIAWVPYFPLGSAFPGFPKVADDPVVAGIAGELGVTGAQVGLAWILAHAPNTLLIRAPAPSPTSRRTSPRPTCPWTPGRWRGSTPWVRPSPGLMASSPFRGNVAAYGKRRTDQASVVAEAGQQGLHPDVAAGPELRR